jgi:hypothetical protein
MLDTPRFFAGVALTLLVITSAQSADKGKKMTDAQKIAYAMSAGPAEIGKNATIMDMDAMPAKQLRAGTNGWMCGVAMGYPMCLDKQWQIWADAWMNKKAFKLDGPGVAYMLRGDNGASNTDPYATKATADNQWVVSPAHVMMLVQDPKMLDSYPTDPKNGGPWVMWKGTPYAHIMVPVAANKTAMMGAK